MGLYRCILLLAVVCTIASSVSCANIAKFLERDFTPHKTNEYIYKRSHVTRNDEEVITKRTIIQNKLDQNDIVPLKSGSNIATPDTFVTPDTKEVLPNTLSFSGMENSGDGSGETEASGYTSFYTGYAKKSKITHKSKNLAVKSIIKKVKPSKDVAKKQFLGVPSQKEGLGGEPVGDLNAEGGLGGLGGDMGGIPTGMGAGAEPLGAYDNNGEPQHDNQARNGLDEGGAHITTGYNRDGPGPNENENTEMYNRESDIGNGPGARPFGKEEDYDKLESSPTVHGNENNMNYESPQADMSESMSNNIGAMDKANIQGDSDVAEMVRQYAAKGKDEFPNSQFNEQSVPDSNDAPFNKGQNSMMDGYDTPRDYYDQKTPQARNFEDERYQKKIPNRNFEYMDTKILEQNFHDYEQKSTGRNFEQMDTKIPERTFQRYQPKLQQQHRKTSGATEDEEKEENFWEKNGDVKFDSGLDNHVANQFPENNFDSINNLEKVLDREITIDKEPQTRANEAFPREEENIFGKINQFSEKVIGNGNSLNAKAAQLGEYFDRESEMFNHKKTPIHAEIPNYSQSANFLQHPNYLQPANHFIQKPQTPLSSKPRQTFQEGVIRGGRLDNMRTGAIRGGRFKDMPNGLTSKGTNFMSNNANIGLSDHKNVKDIQSMVMESTTLYGMAGGFPTQGDIPSVRNAALLPSNLEMTAIDPKVLDMQQLAVEKRIKVQTVNNTHALNNIKTNQSLRTLEKTAMANTGNVKSGRIIIMAGKDFNKAAKPKAEEQAIQRTNLRKDLKKHLIKPDLTPSVPLIKNRLNKINIFKTKAKKQTVIIFPK